MKDLRYGSDDDAPDGTAVARGVYVARRKRSGGAASGCGNDKRKRSIAHDGLKKGTARYKRLKRGIDPKARRIVETANRPKRNRSKYA